MIYNIMLWRFALNNEYAYLEKPLSNEYCAFITYSFGFDLTPYRVVHCHNS